MAGTPCTPCAVHATRSKLSALSVMTNVRTQPYQIRPRMNQHFQRFLLSKREAETKAATAPLTYVSPKSRCNRKRRTMAGSSQSLRAGQQTHAKEPRPMHVRAAAAEGAKHQPREQLPTTKASRQCAGGRPRRPTCATKVGPAAEAKDAQLVPPRQSSANTLAIDIQSGRSSSRM